MAKIRKGDEVIVLTGKDKGKRGVVKVVHANDRVLIDGINQVKKHVRPNPMKGVQGGIIDKSMPIHVSNVSLFDPKTEKPSRVGFKIEGDKKVRILRATGEAVKA
jgi:large subunit ribosomal protein L24